MQELGMHAASPAEARPSATNSATDVGDTSRLHSCAWECQRHLASCPGGDHPSEYLTRFPGTANHKNAIQMSIAGLRSARRRSATLPEDHVTVRDIATTTPAHKGTSTTPKNSTSHAPFRVPASHNNNCRVQNPPRLVPASREASATGSPGDGGLGSASLHSAFTQ